MGSVRIIRNEDIETVLMGVPRGHKHIRVCMKLKDKSTMIFQEATMANILRAYITIKTHPTISAQELRMHVLNKTLRKQKYALHQLLVTSRNEEEIEEELRELLEESTVDV